MILWRRLTFKEGYWGQSKRSREERRNSSQKPTQWLTKGNTTIPLKSWLPGTSPRFCRISRLKYSAILEHKSTIILHTCCTTSASLPTTPSTPTPIPLLRHKFHSKTFQGTAPGETSSLGTTKAHELFLHKLFEHPQGSGTSLQTSRDTSKHKEDKLSRESTSFSATTPSRGRPPPHWAVSGPKKLVFVLFFLPEF